VLSGHAISFKYGGFSTNAPARAGFPLVGRVVRAACWWAARVDRFSFYLELELAL
jgi:hypothetical protein